MVAVLPGTTYGNNYRFGDTEMKKDKLYRCLSKKESYDYFDRRDRCIIGKLEKHADDEVNGEIWMMRIIGRQDNDRGDRLFGYKKGWSNFEIPNKSEFTYIDGKEWVELADKENAWILVDIEEQLARLRKSTADTETIKELIPRVAG